MNDHYAIIRRPLLTEKSLQGSEEGAYSFEVAKSATKPQIKKAVESIFNVHVLKITTSIVRGKIKRLGRNTGKRPNWKKATVQLREGQFIDFFQGA
jgi:large subunit ribosomal protein L23